MIVAIFLRLLLVEEDHSFLRFIYVMARCCGIIFIFKEKILQSGIEQMRYDFLRDSRKVFNVKITVNNRL